jgi:hypothetical protein
VSTNQQLRISLEELKLRDQNQINNV